MSLVVGKKTPSGVSDEQEAPASIPSATTVRTIVVLSTF
jgi:hypothetical protein